jgi:hypothetical protein
MTFKAAPALKEALLKSEIEFLYARLEVLTEPLSPEELLEAYQRNTVKSVPYEKAIHQVILERIGINI